MDYWVQTIERGEKSDDVIKLYGEKPTPEQILEMVRFKGVTYQWKGNGNPIKSYQNIPKAITPSTSELNIDLGGWISNFEVLVLVAELIKIPSQKEKLLRATEGPKEESFERNQEINEDAPVILQGMDQNRGNGSHQPFISLLVNDLLLHNFMLDLLSTSLHKLYFLKSHQRMSNQCSYIQISVIQQALKESLFLHFHYCNKCPKYEKL
jgi:hypothetical protein